MKKMHEYRQVPLANRLVAGVIWMGILGWILFYNRGFLVTWLMPWLDWAWDHPLNVLADAGGGVIGWTIVDMAINLSKIANRPPGQKPPNT